MLICGAAESCYPRSRGIHVGEFAERFDRRLDRERLERDAIALALAEGVFVRRQPARQVGHIYLEDRRGMRRRLLAAYHVLRNQATCGRRVDELVAFHGRDWHAQALLVVAKVARRSPEQWLRLSRLSEARHDVFFADAPVLAGTLYLVEVDLVFLRHAAGEWRDALQRRCCA